MSEKKKLLKALIGPGWRVENDPDLIWGFVVYPPKGFVFIGPVGDRHVARFRGWREAYNLREWLRLDRCAPHCPTCRSRR